MFNKLGLMQGRLSKPVNGLIQSFPSKTWEKEFYFARKLSLSFIEWTLDYKNLYKNPLLTNPGRKKIKKLCKKYKIKINSITGDCFMQRPFRKEKKVRLKNKLIKDLDIILKSTSKLKIKNIIIPLVDNGSISNKLEKDILIKELMRYSFFLTKKKINILFETDFSPNENLNLIKKFGNKNFGINYDIGNSASLNFKPRDEFKIFGKFIKNVHIKDRAKYGGTVPLGQGHANFKLIFSLLKKIKYSGNLILQVARGKTGREFESILEHINFIKKYI